MRGITHPTDLHEHRRTPPDFGDLTRSGRACHPAAPPGRATRPRHGRGVLRGKGPPDLCLSLITPLAGATSALPARPRQTVPNRAGLRFHAPAKAGAPPPKGATMTTGPRGAPAFAGARTGRKQAKGGQYAHHRARADVVGDIAHPMPPRPPGPIQPNAARPSRRLPLVGRGQGEGSGEGGVRGGGCAAAGGVRGGGFAGASPAAPPSPPREGRGASKRRVVTSAPSHRHPRAPRQSFATL